MAIEDPAAELPPGPDGPPVVGSTLQLARDPLGFATRCAREYGDVASFNFRRRPAVQLNHPDAVRHVLVDNNENYRKGEFMRRELGLLGEGLLTSEGEHWRRQRHLIDPIFHPDRIASYGETMVEFTERLLGSWEAGTPVRMEEEMAQLTFEVATDALFSVDVGEETSEISRAISTVMETFGRSRGQPIPIPNWVPTPGNLRYRRAISTFDSVVGDIIDEHRRADDPPDDVVSRLLDATDERGGMSDEQVRDHVLTLMLAGHETTSLALSYTWYLLAAHPEVEARLHEELDAVLGDRSPTVGDLPELTYTERVVKEALRLYPPIYHLVREPIESDEIRGYRVPENALMMVFIWVIHRDPELYDDPEAFRPGRWTEEAERERHPFAFLPFSSGPRRCLGDRFAMMEARLVVATIAQRYRFDLVSEGLDLEPMLTLRPGSPIEMIPRRR